MTWENYTNLISKEDSKHTNNINYLTAMKRLVKWLVVL